MGNLADLGIGLNLTLAELQHGTAQQHLGIIPAGTIFLHALETTYTRTTEQLHQHGFCLIVCVMCQHDGLGFHGSKCAVACFSGSIFKVAVGVDLDSECESRNAHLRALLARKFCPSATVSIYLMVHSYHAEITAEFIEILADNIQQYHAVYTTAHTNHGPACAQSCC